MNERESSVLIEEVTLRGFLSFAPDAEPVKLRALNVLIGPNGSGKSNFLDAFEVLRAAPVEIAAPLQRGGGAGAWVWKDKLGVPAAALSIEVVVRIDDPIALRYRASLASWSGTVGVEDERIEDAKPRGKRKKPDFYYGIENDTPLLQRKGEKGPRALLRADEIHPHHSILADRRDPDIYPQLSQLAARFRSDPQPSLVVLRTRSTGAKHRADRSPHQYPLPQRR